MIVISTWKSTNRLSPYISIGIPLTARNAKNAQVNNARAAARQARAAVTARKFAACIRYAYEMGQGESRTSDESEFEDEECKDCAKMQEDMKKLDESMKSKHMKLKRAESEKRNLKRLLEDKRVQADRYIRKLDEYKGYYKYKTSKLEDELWSKNKLILELNDKRVRLSRSLQWLENKAGQQQKQLERVEAEKVEEQMRREIYKRIRMEEEERSKVRRELSELQ